MLKKGFFPLHFSSILIFCTLQCVKQPLLNLWNMIKKIPTKAHFLQIHFRNVQQFLANSSDLGPFIKRSRRLQICLIIWQELQFQFCKIVIYFVTRIIVAAESAKWFLNYHIILHLYNLNLLFECCPHLSDSTWIGKYIP